MSSTFERLFAETGFAQMLGHLGEPVIYHPAEPGDGPLDIAALAIVTVDRTPDELAAASSEKMVGVQILKAAVPVVREDADFVTVRGERLRVQRITNDIGSTWDVDCA